MRPHRGIIPVLAALALLSAAPAGASRAEGLHKALASTGAVRSVFFVRGMSCRACTLLIDRVLNSKDGVFWARFNYPLRTLVVYHDGKKVRVPTLTQFIAQSGEIEALVLKSGPAADTGPVTGNPVATWKGGGLSIDEAREAPRPFEKMIADFMLERGTEEWRQVVYEIAGEEVRNRILRALASSAGYNPDGGGGDIPVFIAKDFYWPVDMLAATPEEAAVSRFIREKVILGDEGDTGRERFDLWLLEQWKELSLDFRGEALELTP